MWPMRNDRRNPRSMTPEEHAQLREEDAQLRAAIERQTQRRRAERKDHMRDYTAAEMSAAGMSLATRNSLRSLFRRLMEPSDR